MYAYILIKRYTHIDFNLALNEGGNSANVSSYARPFGTKLILGGCHCAQTKKILTSAVSVNFKTVLTWKLLMKSKLLDAAAPPSPSNLPHLLPASDEPVCQLLIKYSFIPLSFQIKSTF